MDIKPILSSLRRSPTGAILVALQIALALAIVVNSLFIIVQRFEKVNRDPGIDVRRLVSIVGEDALSESDRRHLVFADRFERELVHQGTTRRTIEETLDKGWELLRMLPQAELTRIRKELVERYYATS